MIEATTTRQMHEAIENAHKERAAAFQEFLSGWFGLKRFLPESGSAQHA